MKKSDNKDSFPFLMGKKNYQLILIGLAFIVVGYLLMIGGSSDDPNVWNPQIFSFVRIRLSPLLIIIGFVVEVYAILYKDTSK